MNTSERTTQELRTKMAEVATYLSPWFPKDDYAGRQSVILVHPDVEKAGIHVAARDGRLLITGMYPQHFRPLYEKRPHITVSATRSAESIAGDIARRFLPIYIPIFERLEAQAEAWQRALQRRNRGLDELAAVLGVRVDRYHENGRQGEIRRYGQDLVRVIATTSSGDDTVTADLRLDRLPIDVARRVCAVVVEALQGEVVR